MLTDARSLPGVSFLSSTSVYLLSLDIIIRNCNVYKDNIQHEDYSSYIVESLYAMVNLSEELFTEKCNYILINFKTDKAICISIQINAKETL